MTTKFGIEEKLISMKSCADDYALFGTIKGHPAVGLRREGAKTPVPEAKFIKLAAEMNCQNC